VIHLKIVRRERNCTKVQYPFRVILRPTLSAPAPTNVGFTRKTTKFLDGGEWQRWADSVEKVENSAAQQNWRIGPTSSIDLNCLCKSI